MKFCGKCGNQLQSDSLFCDKCGESCAKPSEKGSTVTNNHITEKGSAIIKKVRGDKKLLGIIAVALAVILLVIAFWGVIFPGPESAVKNYVNAIGGDYKSYTKLLPDGVDDLYKRFDMDKEEFEEEYITDGLGEVEEELGRNIKVTYEVIDKEKLSGSRFDKIRDACKVYFDIPRKSIKAAYEFDVEVKAEGSKDEYVESVTLTVYKFNGKWYICRDEWD